MNLKEEKKEIIEVKDWVSFVSVVLICFVSGFIYFYEEKLEMPEGYLDFFEPYYQINQDVIGWLKIEGVDPTYKFNDTNINFPIVQSDNNYHYLNRNFYGEYEIYGNTYMDYNVDVENSRNIVIYGHSRDVFGLYLSNIKMYKSVYFYQKMPIVTFNSVYEEADYKVVALFIEDTSPDKEFFEYHNFINQTDQDYIDEYVQNVIDRSYILTGVDIQPGDEFLTISTCEDNDEANYNRLVLFARKVREGESLEVDTDSVIKNPNQLLPN